MSKVTYDGVVKSVAGFVEQVSELDEKTPHTLTPSVSSMTFYRGQANGEWPLSPKLYREGLFEKESVLISEFMRRAPESFTDMSRFDTLVKMQHYGLPTRMLDMTQNPLVALFFACYGDKEVERDGALYIFPSLPVHRHESNSVSIIMKYVFEYSGMKLHIERFAEDVRSNCNQGATHEKRYEDTSRIVSRLEVPRYAVLPSMANARIARQHGSFLLFGMRKKDIEISDNPGTLGRKYLHFGPVQPKSAKELWHVAQVLRVPSKAKSSILRNLALLGVTKGILFPELDAKAEFVTRLVRRTLD
jgi:hypothetical protein